MRNLTIWKSLSVANILSNWNLFKILKLSLAIMVMGQAIEAKDTFLGLFGFIFFSQAILNIGCCGPQGCAVPAIKKEGNTPKDITFTEVKTSKEIE